MGLGGGGGCKSIHSLFFFFAAPLSFWDFSSPTRDGILAPDSESAKSQPLDQQKFPIHLFFFKNITLFIYVWLCWVFVAVLAFLQLQQAGATLYLRCAGSSLW